MQERKTRIKAFKENTHRRERESKRTRDAGRHAYGLPDAERNNPEAEQTLAVGSSTPLHAFRPLAAHPPHTHVVVRSP